MARPRKTTTASQPPGRLEGPALSRYMLEMANHPLLSHAEEVELAKEVERFEVAYWRSLLSYPRAFGAVAVVLRREMEECPREVPALLRIAREQRGQLTKAQRARWRKAADKLARKLYEADLQRRLVREVHGTLRDLGDDGPRTVSGIHLAPTPALRRYLARVEEARLAQQEVKDRFVRSNLRLVVSMARRYRKSEKLPLEDLIQEGNLGLIKAVERYDHTRGFRFSTYAAWWIRHALTRGLAERGSLVRLPVHTIETRARLAKLSKQFWQKHARRPTVQELAEASGVSLERVREIDGLHEVPLSLDAPVANDAERSFVDLLSDDDQRGPEEDMLSSRMRDRLDDLLEQLSPMEEQIVRHRFGLDRRGERTLKQIGDEYNLSRERIRQIQELALAKMRTRLRQLESA